MAKKPSHRNKKDIIPGWGGQRDGAGRKAVLDKPKLVAIRLPQDQLQRLTEWQKKNGHDSVSEAIRALIDTYC